jgi:hypothetical protein
MRVVHASVLTASTWLVLIQRPSHLQHLRETDATPPGRCSCAAQVCCALAQVAKHSADMAEVVVEAEIFPRVLTCLQYPDDLVRKHAATVVREVRLTSFFFLCPFRMPCFVPPDLVCNSR